ncbi:hypothetical protein FA15DRAFT_483810 [Coprinopsis marcescibilis]|uniref:Zn(2)-C6 fungal-type domain-containing protein n=1 Tax=Coprinopsis marcescibilis TaxID=230819 RepID=A0A5C3L863_COPMA|nr:hypothetical protein FA15DRAFT_483810 [Coprinopsis marcescibilis]
MSTHPTRRRTDMACLTCRHRKIKCESNKPLPCKTCKEKGRECKYVPVAEDDHMLNLAANRTTPPVAYNSPNGHTLDLSPYSKQASPSQINAGYYQQSSYAESSYGYPGLPSPAEERTFDSYQGYSQHSPQYSAPSYTATHNQAGYATSPHDSSHPNSYTNPNDMSEVPTGMTSASEYCPPTWSHARAHPNGGVSSPILEQGQGFCYPSPSSPGSSTMGYHGNVQQYHQGATQYHATATAGYQYHDPQYNGQPRNYT